MSEEKPLGVYVPSSGQDALRRLSAVHNGMTYPGEMVLLRRWDSQWGQQLRGDTYFRVVFLSRPDDAPLVTLEDPKIAVCVPGARLPRERQILERELLSVREARERYLARPAPGEEGARRTLETQQVELESRLLEAEAQRYREGEIITLGDTVVGKEVFAGHHAEGWAEAIAYRLLASCYSTLWLDLRRLTRPLVPQDAGGLFRALFADPDDPAGYPLEEMGPALGLSTLTDPRRFDSKGCRVFRMIQRRLGGRDDLPWEEVYHYLSRQVGLTDGFALLSLLVYAYDGHPEVELRLRRGHGLVLRDGQTVQGDRLIRELVPMLPWDERLGESIISIHRPKGVSWNSALHYTSLVCGDLTEADDGEDVQAQGRRLRDSLRNLARDVRRGLEALLAIASSGLSLSSEAMEERLTRLSSLAMCRGFSDLYRQARASYGTPGRLRQDLEDLGRLLRLSPLLPEIMDTRSYLEGAQTGPGYGELSLDRASLLERIVMPVVLESAHVWPALKASFEQFKKRYADAYAAFHASYHDETAAMQERLERARRSVGALGYLNSLTELGKPVGTDLGSRLERVAKRVRACSVTEDGLQLDHSPRCLQCDVALGTRPPTREAASLVAEVEAALGEQNQRLSRLLVRDIMQGRADQRLDDLLKIVQASDLSALVNTLDEEMAEFIRGLLVQ